MPLDIRRASGSRPQMQLTELTDFNGGLNLQADPLGLGPNECPELLNVDIDRRGGFQLRKGYTTLTTVPYANDPRALSVFVTSAGVEQVIANIATNVLYSTDGGASFNIITGMTSALPSRCSVFNGNLYYQRGATQAAVRWNGAAGTALTANAPTWQDDLGVTSATYMPTAELIASHLQYMWVANTLENAVAFPSRVRWSHPGFPESWRSYDYIDVEVGKDNDEITALVPMEDHMLVFKKGSVHAIHGYDPFSFSVVPLNQEIGTISQESVVSTPWGVYFFDSKSGVWHYDGKRFKWVFGKIEEALRDNRIPPAYRSLVTLGWVDNRLWVGTPWEAAAQRSHAFVFDPETGRDGAWTFYDTPVGPFCTLADGTELAGMQDTGCIVQLEIDQPFDDIDGVETHIDSYLRTHWVDAGSLAVIKRWKRPDLILKGGQTQSVIVEVYRDWDPRSAFKSFAVALEPSGTAARWGTTGVPEDGTDGSLWDGGAVYQIDGDYNEVHKGSALGVARSVALKFRGPQTTNTTWGVDGIAFKYRPKRVRG